MNDDKCRHCGREPVILRVQMPSELSYTGEPRSADKAIDACIAPIVAALNAAGIYTASSCCGHGWHGDIRLHDGRVLVVKRPNPVRPGDGQMAEDAPLGFVRLGAWTNGQEVVIEGMPPDEDMDDERADVIHNCDAMGCGLAHVLLRQPVDWPQYRAKEMARE